MIKHLRAGLNLVRDESRGFVLMTSYLLISVVSIVSLAVFSRGYVYQDATERNQNKLVAFNAAEAGLDWAIRELMVSDAFRNNTEVGEVPSAYINMDSTASQGGYGILVGNRDEFGNVFADVWKRKVEVAGHAPVNTGLAVDYQCPPSGSSPGVRAYECRSFMAYVRIDPVPFKYAAFADVDLHLRGNAAVVDSYDSRIGAYGGANIHNHGDLATDGNITFVGNPNHSGEIIMNPGIRCAPQTTNTPSSGNLRVMGSTVLQLPGGTYHYDSITIAGNGQLQLLGPVTIYVSGSVYIGGNGIVTKDNDPTNLLIIATGDDDIDVAGNGDFYGGIMAMDSLVENTGGGDIFGAILAKNFDNSGQGDLHYDEAMADRFAPCYQVNLLSWREVNSTATV